MNTFNNCVAVITGAGSGIGQQLSVQLAQAGANLAISDVNADGLQETLALIKDLPIEVDSQLLDVADETAFFTYADTVVEKFGKVNLVINNAGVGLASGQLWTTPMEDFKWLFNINFFGVLYGTKAFLPLLKQSDWGHIVNISSLFGLISVPQQSAYNASKFAVRGLTEALRQELELDNSSVSCTSVHPGGIKTNIARQARVSDNGISDLAEKHRQAIIDFDKVTLTTAESAASQILRAVQKNKRRLLIGIDAKFIDFIQRLMPNHYQRVMKLILGKKFN